MSFATLMACVRALASFSKPPLQTTLALPLRITRTFALLPWDPVTFPILPFLVFFFCLDLRVRPPGIEWKTCRDPKIGKNWPKNRKWPSARNGEKNGPKMAKKKIENGAIFLFFGQFLPIFGFRHVYARRPDLQALTFSCLDVFFFSGDFLLSKRGGFP